MSAPIIICPIKKIDEKNSIVNISEQLRGQLSINKNQELKISIGKKILPATIQTMKMENNKIQLSEGLLQDFSLPIHEHLFLANFVHEKKVLQLCPVIGLLTDFNRGESEDLNFGSIHSFCEELHQGVTSLGGFFYVFHYKDLTEQGVHGYYFYNGKWSFSELPLPNVIYNRVHSRKVEKTACFKSFRKKLKQLNIPFFNDRFLSKWEVHEILALEEKLKPHIPDTKILSKESLENFLEKYKTVFIKPINGSQGRNIIKLFKENESIHIQSSQNFLEILKKKSVTEVFHCLKPLIQNKIYIIQQGIPLTTFDLRPMDFRILCNRNENNQWKVTSLIARVSTECQFVSNLAKGGEAMNPSDALSIFFDKRVVKGMIISMKKLSIEASSIISDHSEGITGELGIDIGIDPTGTIWIIEINSKPSKNFSRAASKIRPSAKAIIQFCTKLAFDFC